MAESTPGYELSCVHNIKLPVAIVMLIVSEGRRSSVSDIVYIAHTESSMLMVRLEIVVPLRSCAIVAYPQYQCAMFSSAHEKR